MFVEIKILLKYMNNGGINEKKEMVVCSTKKTDEGEI